jgi:Ca2+/Na+ antiporter
MTNTDQEHQSSNKTKKAIHMIGHAVAMFIVCMALNIFLLKHAENPPANLTWDATIRTVSILIVTIIIMMIPVLIVGTLKKRMPKGMTVMFWVIMVFITVSFDDYKNDEEKDATRKTEQIEQTVNQWPSGTKPADVHDSI